jgi:hypothetical protein
MLQHKGMAADGSLKSGCLSSNPGPPLRKGLNLSVLCLLISKMRIVMEPALWDCYEEEMCLGYCQACGMWPVPSVSVKVHSWEGCFD